MGVISYKKQLSPGISKTFYLVIAEGVNKYTGQRVQKKKRGISSEVKAQRVYRELWSLCREEKPNDPGIKTWGGLKDNYISFVESKVRSDENPSGYSPQTVVTKKSYLAHFKSWTDLHLDLINPIFLRDELDKFEKNGMSRALTNDLQKEVKRVFGYSVELGVLRSSPLADMKERKVPRRRKEALTHGEVDQLLLEAKRRNHPYYFVWVMSLVTGLRRSELAGLKWTDLDLESGLILVRRQLIPGEGFVNFTKDKEERIVALPSSSLPVLKEARLASRSEFVIDVNCPRWDRGEQAKVLREFCQEIGIKEVTHHQLRATYITLAIIDGVPLGIVKENVGHAKLSTTDEYFRSSGIQLRGQVDGLKISLPKTETGVVLPLRAIK